MKYLLLRLRCPLALAAVLSLFFLPGGIAAAESNSTSPPNQLTAAEKAADWQLLFDGKSFAGWHGYGTPGMPAAGWEVADGMIHVIGKSKSNDLITERKFTDFELSWEWRIAEVGNNGVKYFVNEKRPDARGHEYQMLDDDRHPDGKLGANRQTAAFYDVLPAAADKPVRTPGEWNVSRIIVRGGHVEHWLNGKNVLTYELGSPEVKAGLAKSKFKNAPGFGDKITGPILLTYHETDCWFRSVKIRELK